MIRLRKPPTIQLQESRFVPEIPLAEISEKWARICEENPAYFDGDILHVLGVHRNGCGGATIQVAKTSYRFHAVADAGVTPLGVKGICMQAESGAYLCGLRGNRVGVYPNMWEFAPSGMVEPNEQPSDCIQRELAEETGLQISSPPLAIAILFDEEARTWEIIYQLQVEGTRCCDGTEYVELDWFDVKEMPTPMSPPAVKIKSLL